MNAYWIVVHHIFLINILEFIYSMEINQLSTNISITILDWASLGKGVIFLNTVVFFNR